MKKTTSDRLKEVMSERNLKQVDILRISEPFQKLFNIKMGKSALSQYVSGKSSPDQDKLYLLSKTLDINEPWLMGYDVPKERIPDEERKSFSSGISTIYNQLVPLRQEKVYDFAKNQLEDQEKENSRNKNVTSLEQYKERKQQKKSMATIDWCGTASAGTGEFLCEMNKEKITLPAEIIPADADFCLSVNGNSMEPIFHDKDYVFIKEQLEVFSGAIGVVIVNGEAFLKRIWFENDHARLQSFNTDYEDIIVTDDDEFKIIGKVVM